MGRLLVAAVGAAWLAVVLVATPGAAAQTCKFRDPQSGMEMEYYCGGPNAGQPVPASEAKEEPWWATSTAQAVYAFAGLAGSAGAGAYAYYRVKRRRELLKGFMTRIDEAASAHKAAPDEGAALLASIRAELATLFHAHRVDDAHYLELDKRAATAIAKLRSLELDQRFPSLPPALRGQVTTLVSDGKVSQADVDLVRGSSAGALVPARLRDDLVGMLRTWAAQDAGDAVAPPPAKPVEQAAADPPREPLVRLRPPS